MSAEQLPTRVSFSRSSTDPPPKSFSAASERQTGDVDFTAVVTAIQSSWARVQPHTEELAKHFYTLLFHYAPETRDLFPINMQVQRSRLLRAVVHIVHMVDRPVELAPFLAQLGRDHRKFGVLAHHYHALSTAMIDTVRHYNGTHWDSVTEQSWQHAFAQVNTVMQDAANAETGPASWPARVTSHHRITRDIALVQVHTGAPIPYQPGQYLSVETPQRPRLWRYLSPANPTNHEGVIEFHVRAVPEGWVSQSVVAHTQRGDTWHIGSPMGNLHLRHHPNRELLLIAGGTGIAPCLAILQDRARQNGNTPVQVFYGASAVEDLYALHTLHRLTAQLPRLTVIPACHQTTSQPGGVEHGTLADVVTRYGSWTNHDVLICGSPQMIRATVTAMLLAGTPLANIHHDPFTLD